MIKLLKHAHAICSDFKSCKKDNFKMKEIDSFLIIALKH